MAYIFQKLFLQYYKNHYNSLNEKNQISKSNLNTYNFDYNWILNPAQPQVVINEDLKSLVEKFEKREKLNVTRVTVPCGTIVIGQFTFQG